jgi:hypothetical protein
MQSINKLNIILKSLKKLKFSLYFFLPLFLFVIYLCTPKLLNFSSESIKKKLKDANSINISNISKIEYKIFPTPRLSLPSSNFTIGEDIFEVNNGNLEIILNIIKILNFREINYKKLLITKGSSKINLDKVNHLFAVINKNKKKLVFKKNNILFLQKEKIFLEIRDVLIQMSQHGIKKKLILNGSFLNNKIFINLNSTSKYKNNLILKIPELDIVTRIFFNKNNSDNTSGFLNLEVFNNLLKFNFTKGNNIRLKDGFIRSKLVNTSLEGEITVNPNFFSKIDFEISNLNMKKLFPIVQEIFFQNNINNLPLIKKINGVFNFKSSFEGRVINRNGEIFFEDFKVGKNKSFFFNAKITEFGNNGSVQFNLIKTVEDKRGMSKKIEIKGALIPSKSRVVFEKILIDGAELPAEKTKDYESEFEDSVVLDSLENIFHEGRVNKYFKNLL